MKYVSDAEVQVLCDRVRQTAYEIHCYHVHGHLEKVYENALVHRLQKSGLEIGQQEPILVYDQDGTVIGNYFADILVNQYLILELKAVRELIDEHTAQIIGYLKSARIRHGLLINFGANRFQIRKYVL